MQIDTDGSLRMLDAEMIRRTYGGTVPLTATDEAEKVRDVPEGMTARQYRRTQKPRTRSRVQRPATAEGQERRR